jgi:hypothetical protein
VVLKSKGFPVSPQVCNSTKSLFSTARQYHLITIPSAKSFAVMISQLFVHPRLAGFCDMTTVAPVISVAIFALLLTPIALLNWVSFYISFGMNN